MFRKTRDGASASGPKIGLPDERKALAERYTIDAKEAEARVVHRAIRREAAEAEDEGDRAREEATTVALETARAFPIYSWLQQAAAPPGDTVDWTRALLETQEEKERGETPLVWPPTSLAP